MTEKIYKNRKFLRLVHIVNTNISNLGEYQKKEQMAIFLFTRLYNIEVFERAAKELKFSVTGSYTAYKKLLCVRKKLEKKLDEVCRKNQYYFQPAEIYEIMREEIKSGFLQEDKGRWKEDVSQMPEKLVMLRILEVSYGIEMEFQFKEWDIRKKNTLKQMPFMICSDQLVKKRLQKIEFQKGIWMKFSSDIKKMERMIFLEWKKLLDSADGNQKSVDVNDSFYEIIQKQEKIRIMVYGMYWKHSITFIKHIQQLNENGDETGRRIADTFQILYNAYTNGMDVSNASPKIFTDSVFCCRLQNIISLCYMISVLGAGDERGEEILNILSIPLQKSVDENDDILNRIVRSDMYNYLQPIMKMFANQKEDVDNIEFQNYFFMRCLELEKEWLFMEHHEADLFASSFLDKLLVKYATTYKSVCKFFNFYAERTDYYEMCARKSGKIILFSGGKHEGIE